MLNSDFDWKVPVEEKANRVPVSSLGGVLWGQRQCGVSAPLTFLICLPEIRRLAQSPSEVITRDQFGVTTGDSIFVGAPLAIPFQSGPNRLGRKPD